MKLFVVALFACLLLGCNTPPSVSIKWNPVPIVPIGYNVYRAPCLVPLPSLGPGTCTVEGAFTRVGNTGPGVTTYTDTTVSSGQSYSLYVTASYPEGESAASDHVGVAIP